MLEYEDRSNVLFLNVAAYGHVNPTLGLVDELVKKGESVTYFCTDEFKNEIEKTGAHFISYSKETNPLTLLILLNILFHIQNIMIIVLYLLVHQYIIEKKT